ncbi:MAG: hypothetical protein GXP54_03780 [Deltaproteobacteria bacterium]|nr:hypothetical protein [Deltaproteobacteria bacterium]
MDRNVRQDPAELIVFMSPQCPHCGRVVAMARALALDNPKIHLRVVDARKEPEIAASYSVRSVPTTILDGDLTWMGPVSAEDILDALNSRGGTGYAKRLSNHLSNQGEWIGPWNDSWTEQAWRLSWNCGGTAPPPSGSACCWQRPRPWKGNLTPWTAWFPVCWRFCIQMTARCAATPPICWDRSGIRPQSKASRPCSTTPMPT